MQGTQQINYFSFIRLLHIDDRHLVPAQRSDYFGFEIKPDGVWMFPPDDPTNFFSHRITYRFKRTHTWLYRVPSGKKINNWIRLKDDFKKGIYKDKVRLSFKRPENGWPKHKYQRFKYWPTYWPSFVFLKNDQKDIEQSLTMEDFFSGFYIHELENKPVLAFPCSPNDLLDFLAKSGLDGMVAPDDLAMLEESKATALASTPFEDEQPESGGQSIASNKLPIESSEEEGIKRFIEDRLLEKTMDIAIEFNTQMIASGKLKQPLTWDTIQKRYYRELKPYGLPLRYPQKGKKYPSIFQSEIAEFIKTLR